jgi:hypothetical protein
VSSDDNKVSGGSGGSDIVGDVTKVADTKLMTLLLGRSAKAAGDFIGDWTEDFFKNLKKQSAQSKWTNLEGHVSNVVDRRGGVPLDVQPAHIIKFERWAKIAADIPLQDAELSAVIEAVLEDILSAPGTSDFQEAAEKLTSGTARLLLNAPAEDSITPKGSEQREFEQLKSLGLARTPKPVNVVAAWLVGVIVALFFLFGVILRYAPSFLPGYFPIFLATEFIIEAIVVSAIVVWIGILIIRTRYGLTEFGKALQRSARRFYPQERKPRTWRRLGAIARGSWVWGGLAALLVCFLPFVLQAYLPSQLRIDSRPPTIIISSLPTNPGGPAPTPPSSAPPTTTPPSTSQQALTADEVRTLIDVWRSVAAQMNDIITITNDSDAVFSNWPQRLKGDSLAVAQDLTSKRDTLNQDRAALQYLLTSYKSYPNIEAALSEVQTGAIFNRFYAALDTFATRARLLGAPPPENFEDKLRPYAGELKGALDSMAKWAASTRTFAKLQSNELSNQVK